MAFSGGRAPLSERVGGVAPARLVVPDAEAAAMTVWAIVVAGGSGSRFGRPKQFELVAGRTVLERSLDAARVHCDGVVAVVPAGYGRGTPAGAHRTVVGGATRSASVRAGLAAVPDEATVVVVHDAARPLATPTLFAAVLRPVLEGADAALPAVPITDTVRRRGGGLVDRSELLAVQTPQAFAAAALRRAHAGGDDATDDASLVERHGGRVVVVPGEATNLKITRAEDLAVAEALLTGRGAGASPGETVAPAGHDGAPAGDAGGTGGWVPAPTTAPAGGRAGGLAPGPVRIGHGFDVHPFGSDPARPLVLGGVHFDGHLGLAGHSDADVVAHAVTDALLGAAGLGDIGQLFPDTDPAFAGADSLVLLAEAVRRVRRAGWAPGSVDCTVVAESPRLASRRAEMEARLGAVVGAPVNVKGKRAEGLGALGRREGIACWAVAVLVALDPS